MFVIAVKIDFLHEVYLLNLKNYM